MPSDPAAALAEVGRIQTVAGTAVATHPLGALWIALIDQTSMPLPSPLGPLTAAQFGEFVVTPQLLHAVFINDVVMHTKDKFPISNVGTTYTAPAFAAGFGLSMPFVNANVARVEAEKAAVTWVEHYGETSGDISIPTVTIHTRYDTWVPIFHESIYKQRVDAAGKSGLLVQRTTEGFGHCNFLPMEIGHAMADLAAWVEHGIKPAP